MLAGGGRGVVEIVDDSLSRQTLSTASKRFYPEFPISLTICQSPAILEIGEALPPRHSAALAPRTEPLRHFAILPIDVYCLQNFHFASSIIALSFVF